MAVQEEAMRRQFLSDALSSAILTDPTPFYEAFEDGEDALESFLTARWEALCDELDESLAAHPFFPEITPYILEDDDEGFCALVAVTIPKTVSAPSMMGAIVFGSAMDPRVFAALPVVLKKGQTLGMIECREDGERAIGVLHQGCDNGMQLFDPPNPQKRDPDAPLPAARRHTAFVDAVVCWCLQND